MSKRLELARLALGLALILGNFVPIGIASAQEASTDAVHRKVKSRVSPEYPALARQMKVRGKVKIEATIAADGRVTNTKVVGGSPVLVDAAIDALRKWRFEAAPKETSEIIEFDFGNQN